LKEVVVKRSDERILTTHVGSMPRPPELRALDPRPGEPHDAEAYNRVLRASIADIVRKQLEVGLDVINDGELYKPSWSGYVGERLQGFEDRPVPPEAEGWSFIGTEAKDFSGYFSERSSGPGGIGGGGLGAPGGRGGTQVLSGTMMACVAPLTYVGQDLVRRDVENFKAALQGVQPVDTFMAAVGPDNVGYQPGVNRYYPTDDDYIRGCAQALKHEYKAITDAGFVLQLDTPVMKYKALEMTVPEFRRRFATLVEILNDTLADIPQEQVRIHICYGGGRGPHTGDIGLRDYVDLALKINCTGISLDQNVQHEHEWAIWEDVKLPDDKVLIPGVVAHTTDTVEHPELIAQRIVRLAKLVGRERVIAGTDCGLGGRLHPDIVWAKFRAMAEGARRATKQLWR
jgi:5-methyltetrahydropteroyltriglutamate--homocysteine methyltransferase